MSMLVRPPKRKLHEVEPLDDGPRKYSSAVVSSSTVHLSTRPPSRRSSEHREASGDSHLRLLEPYPNRGSPTLLEHGHLQTPRTFSPTASVVLIGIRGTGKSSLAVILAATSGRRLIDADRYFHQSVGCSRAMFRKENDGSVYRQQEARVFESMLADNQEGCVIACGAGSMESNGQILLREFAQTHPVIHIIRDPESIQSYLKAWDTQKVRHFLELSGPIYRKCSNLEFFNLSEARNDGLGKGSDNSSLTHRIEPRSHTPVPFLTLKRVQRDFLRFIAFITGDIAELNSQHASFPLSLLPVESRMYTSAVSVPFSRVCEKRMDIEQLEFTADAFELAVDVTDSSGQPGLSSSLADSISQAVSVIRRNIIVPLIYHVESYTISTGSLSPNQVPVRCTDETYFNLVQHGLRLSTGFLTVDLTRDDTIISQIISASGRTRIIGHFEAFHPLPGGWDGDEYMKVYERAKSLGCDIVRMCQPAQTPEDNLAVQRFRHRIQSLPVASLPLIAYNTGPLGRMSRCFNPILSPVTHPSLVPEYPTHLRSCITAREAQKALYSSFALDPMQFFVFGANTTYSLSPAMHNTAFKICGLPHNYSIHQSPTLRGLNDLVENQYFGGSSVSLPYKTECIPLLHSMSTHARAIGAINTLIPIRNLDDLNDTRLQESSIFLQKSRAGPIKGLHGDNTDWIGICNCIRRGLSPANAVRSSSTGLVIGSGGMARAAIYSMIHLGVQNVFIYNRTLANAERLAHHYNRQDLHSKEARGPGRPTVRILASLSDPWPADFKQPTIVVSGIPAHSIGGEPAPNFQMPAQWLESPTGGVVVDLAYKPLNTPLMKQTRALSHRGWVALDGLDVLPEQGFAQFELFTGRRAPRRVMRSIVLQEYKDDEGNNDHQAIQDRLQQMDGQPT
ncbi:Shikimate kinase [Penicillium cf. griseofulvum]|uniref:Shikimate kinase n=1 Tax=Penicillium cf. griseofulvum TaxID=2972120 RepID=A0A9W9M2X6_9EURO|nr:Shikimate kinase [Penicillium cf. griseofulvum]KAJ5429679.1 Shikimate kinase [Penicillium cf. griseofulvum]